MCNLNLKAFQIKKVEEKKNNIEKITTFVIEVGEKSNFKMKCNLLQRFVTS
ncbi:hypothetical protein CQW35_01627 [Bacteroides fragilis]|nr:hypothetical protein CQW35_01627 [Bacteroides fragilis]